MKKLSLKGARILGSVVCVALLIVVSVFCFLPSETVSIVSGESYAPVYRSSKGEAKVALMFNVYENTATVEEIISLLDNYGVKATFFVGGCWADDNNDTLNRILSSGHGLGNHGYFHKNHKKISEKENFDEIKNTHQLVLAITGFEMNLFAPPSGAFSTTTLKVAQKLGYKTIMWSKDTIDWRDSDVDLIVKRATEVESGDFVLMHPKAHTLKALPKILDFYKEKGIVPSLVSEMI